jgi:hypothetical protein
MPLTLEYHWIEVVMHNAMERAGAILCRPIRDTPFEYWLLDREGQVDTFFFSLIIGSLILLSFLEYSVRRSSKLVALAALSGVAEADVDPVAIKTVQVPAPSQQDQGVPIASTGDTPFMTKLAQSGHRPTNAHLNISPSHLARNLGKPPVLSASNPLASHPQGRNFSGLFEPNSTPLRFGGSPDVGDKPDLRSSSPLQGRNFAAMKESAPISYDALRERGLLDEDGSPTAKFRLYQLLSDESS